TCEPVLLHDRRVPLRIHRPCRRFADRGDDRSDRRQCRSVLAQLAPVPDRIQAAPVTEPAHPPPSVEVRLLAQPRRFRSVNWIGIGTLFRREVKRGLKDHLDSVWGPVVANLLYLAVFGLAGAMVDAVAAERLLLFVG